MLILASVFLILLLLGVPVLVSIAMASFAVMLSVLPFDQAVLVASQKIFSGVDRFSLIAIPLFILAGNILNQGGVARRLIRLSTLIGQRMPHSILHTNIIGNMLFGSISGSATAAAVGIGSIIEPQARKEGYDPAFITCVNVTSAPSGLLIPPSNTLILYSVVSGQASVIVLFLAGYLPGVIMGLGIMLLVGIWGSANQKVPQSKKPGRSAEHTLGKPSRIIFDSLPSLLLIFIIIFGIVGGIFTANEAAGIAVLYALLLTLLYGNLDWRGYGQILIESAQVSGVILLIIAASNMMGWVLAYTQAPEAISRTMLSLSENKYAILLIINLILLFIGTFLDMSPAVLIFTPIFLPVATGIGIHPVHFGIIMTYNLCIGILTPPVGTMLFVGSSVSRIPVKRILSKIIPFYIILIATLFLITFIPAISLALPKLAGLL